MYGKMINKKILVILIVFIALFFSGALSTNVHAESSFETPLDLVYTKGYWEKGDLIGAFINLPQHLLNETEVSIEYNYSTYQTKPNEFGMIYFQSWSNYETITLSIYHKNKFIGQKKIHLHQKTTNPSEKLQVWSKQVEVYESGKFIIHYDANAFSQNWLSQMVKGLNNKYEYLLKMFDVPKLAYDQVELFLVDNQEIWSKFSPLTYRAQADKHGIYIGPQSMYDMNALLEHELIHVFSERYLLSFYDQRALQEGFSEYYSRAQSYLDARIQEYVILLNENKLLSPFEYMMLSNTLQDLYAYSFGTTFVTYVMEEYGVREFISFVMKIPSYTDSLSFHEAISSNDPQGNDPWRNFLLNKQKASNDKSIMAKSEVLSTILPIDEFSLNHDGEYLLMQTDTLQGFTLLSKMKKEFDTPQFSLFLYNANAQFSGAKWSPSGDRIALFYNDWPHQEIGELRIYEQDSPEPIFTYRDDNLRQAQLSWVDDNSLVVSNRYGGVFHWDLKNNNLNTINNYVSYSWIDVSKNTQALLGIQSGEVQIIPLSPDFRISSPIRKTMVPEEGEYYIQAIWNPEGTHLAMLSASYEDQSYTKMTLFDVTNEQIVKELEVPFVQFIQWNGENLTYLQSTKAQRTIYTTDEFNTIKRGSFGTQIEIWISLSTLAMLLTIIFIERKHKKKHSKVNFYS